MFAALVALVLGHSTFVWIGITGTERQNGGQKNYFFCESKVKELKFFNILRAYELKLWPNLGCRTENSLFWGANFSCRSQNLSFLHKVGSKELNHVATGDLKSSTEAWKGGLDSWTYLYTSFSGECPPRVKCPFSPGEDFLFVACSFFFFIKLFDTITCNSYLIFFYWF